MVQCPRCEKIYKKEGKCWKDHVSRGCQPSPLPRVVQPVLSPVPLTRTKLMVVPPAPKRRRSPRLAVEELRRNQDELWNLFTRQDHLLHELQTLL
jgi:hypothetical protein